MGIGAFLLELRWASGAARIDGHATRPAAAASNPSIDRGLALHGERLRLPSLVLAIEEVFRRGDEIGEARRACRISAGVP
jgi:hypothetical protein